MASPADGLTRLEKVAVFLIALGEHKAREVLADIDLRTVEQINSAILKLGPVRPEVKAAVMIEFSDYFYKDKPLSEKLAEPPRKKKSGAKTKPGAETKPGAKTKQPKGKGGTKIGSKTLYKSRSCRRSARDRKIRTMNPTATPNSPSNITVSTAFPFPDRLARVCLPTLKANAEPVCQFCSNSINFI